MGAATGHPAPGASRFGGVAVQVLKWTAIILVTALLVSVAATFVLAQTNWGRERVRRFAVRQLENALNGQVTIGRVRGNLLTGATVEAVAIRDSAGQPFFAAERVSARYRILDLLTRKIDLRSVHVVQPIVFLDRPPGGKWNYQRIFPPSDPTKPRSERRKGFPWIILRDLTVVDGQLLARSPWKPDTTLSRAAQDSSVRIALGGKKRVKVIRSGTGFQKVVELREVTARVPLMRITQPGFQDRLARIATLSMVALPFRPPAAIISDLAGNLRFDNDSIWWTDVTARLPGSLIRGDGRYTFDGGDMTVVADAQPAALADFRFVFPRLPSDGGGPLKLKLEWRGTTQEYFVRDADLRSNGARVRGRFAIGFADTFAIHDTDVRFTNVSTKLVEQVAAGFTSPRRGTLDGRLAILGGRNALHLAGNVAFHDASAGTSRAAGSGAIGFGGGDFRMRNLRVRVDPLQVSLLKAVNRPLAGTLGPIGGTVVGNLTIDGSARTRLAISGDAEHLDRSLSRLRGRAEFRFAGTNSFDVDVQARPLSLTEVGLFVPSLGLRGGATGPIHVSGTTSDFRIATALRLPGGGFASANGRLNFDGRVPHYDLTGGLRSLNLNAVMSSAPRTRLTANVRARGSGTRPETMNGAIAAEFAASSWDSVAVDSGSIRVALRNGLATVERLMASGSGTTVEAAGTFGLVAGRAGELRYTVAVDSLAAYNHLIPGAEDTTLMRPRPALVARAIARARADSIRIARETEVERAATGRPMPRIPVDMPPSLARSALSGRLYAAGTLHGNVREFDTRGRLAADDVIARGHAAGLLRAEYAWIRRGQAAPRIVLGVEGSRISIAGFAFDSIEGRLAYSRPSGEIALVVRQGDDRDYSVSGAFVLGPRRQARVEQLALRMDTTIWQLSRPATVSWSSDEVEVRDAELRSNTGGLVQASGIIPARGVAGANLTVDVQNFQVADVATFLQSDLGVRGILTARGKLEGTTRDPRFHGAAGLVNGEFNGATIPETRATFSYASGSLNARGELLRRNGHASVVADATLAIHLGLGDARRRPLLDTPIRLDVTGDSLPLDLIPGFTDQVEQIRGKAAGAFAMRGTLRRPSLAGGITWLNGSIRIVSTGMLVEGINGSIRMTRDTVFVDSIAGVSRRGPLRLAGRVAVGDWRTPAFDLSLTGANAEVLHSDNGRLDADVGLSVTGPLTNLYVAGLVQIREGVIYIPEPNSKLLVNPGDPAVFAVVDTALLGDQELFPKTDRLFENLRLDVDVTVSRNTWLRSREANIELFTEEPVRVHRSAGALALTGVISTERGEYTFFSKRFEIKRGSATFVGGAELNPALQATGEYEVSLTGRQNFNIRVVIGGTFRKPKLTLESDAQPPISQSDLLSYLAFGRSTSSLLQSEGSGLTGATATGNLIGVGAALAMRRLAAVALGVMVDEVEGEATKGLGADVFNITPADVPTELGGRGVIDFLASTRIEAGKYLSRNFFMALQAQKYPGIRGQYRTSKGWRFEASVEPRFLLVPPSLAAQPIPAVTSFGLFIIREWRF